MSEGFFLTWLYRNFFRRSDIENAHPYPLVIILFLSSLFNFILFFYRF